MCMRGVSVCGCMCGVSVYVHVHVCIVYVRVCILCSVSGGGRGVCVIASYVNTIGHGKILALFQGYISISHLHFFYCRRDIN